MGVNILDYFSITGVFRAISLLIKKSGLSPPLFRFVSADFNRIADFPLFIVLPVRYNYYGEMIF